MGLRGPLAQPAALRALKGNPGHRKAAATGPKPPPVPPKMPRWSEVWPLEGDAAQLALARQLARDAAAEWRIAVPELGSAGAIPRADGSRLAEYCRDVASLRHCERTLAREGFLVEGRQGGQVKHPLASVAAALRERRCAPIARIWGSAPAPRARLRVTEPDQADKWDELLDSAVDPPRSRRRPAARPARMTADEARAGIEAILEGGCAPCTARPTWPARCGA